MRPNEESGKLGPRVHFATFPLLQVGTQEIGTPPENNDIFDNWEQQQKQHQQSSDPLKQSDTGQHMQFLCFLLFKIGTPVFHSIQTFTIFAA